MSSRFFFNVDPVQRKMFGANSVINW